ncbi:MAG: hypothetical protein EXR79_13080 [Myxococcales bacterium]|nr:hypothetical protein [Myxococcales bacterium]
MPMRRLLVTALIGAAALGCSAPITYGQSAEVLGKGKVQVALGVGMSASTSAVTLLDEAVSQMKVLHGRAQSPDCKADKTKCVQASQLDGIVRAAYTAGFAGLVEPVLDLSAKYGIAQDLAIGGRLTTGAKRLDVDWQAFRTDGWAGALTLSYTYQKGEAPFVQSILDKIMLDDFTRHYVEAVFAAGKRFSDWGWLSFGPRLGMSKYHIDMKTGIDLPFFDDLGIRDPASQAMQGAINSLPQTDADGTALAAGGFVNFFAGWKYVWLGAELSGVYHRSTATVLGKKETMGALQLQPSLLLLTRF